MQATLFPVTTSCLYIDFVEGQIFQVVPVHVGTGQV